MATHYVQSNTLYLAGSGVVAADTSVTLTAFTDIYGNVLTMSDFGAIGYITLEPDTTNEEAAQFTGITANANGTYTLTGVSTLLAVSPYTATSGLVRSHVGGSKVVITDNVGFWNTFGNVNNTNTWADVQTFSVPAVQATNPTLSTQVANKAYVDGVAIAGAPDATTTVKGIGKVSVAPASPTSPVFVGDNDPRVAPNDYATSTGSANAYVLTLGAAPAALAAGQQYSFKANFTNTGASTLNVNSLGAKNIYKLASTALVAGDIISGAVVIVRYDGTEFQLVSPPGKTATSTLDTGTSANQIVELNSSAQLPAVDGSLLTGIPIFKTSGAPGTTTTNTTATVLTYSLPGGVLSTNKGVRMRFATSVAVVNTTASGTYTVSYGGTTIASWIFGGSSTSQTYNLIVDLVLMGAGATNSQVASTVGSAERAAGTTGSAAASGLASTFTAAIDSTTAQNIVVSCTAAASVTGTLISYFIESI